MAEWLDRWSRGLGVIGLCPAADFFYFAFFSFLAHATILCYIFCADEASN